MKLYSNSTDYLVQIGRPHCALLPIEIKSCGMQAEINTSFPEKRFLSAKAKLGFSSAVCLRDAEGAKDFSRVMLSSQRD